MPRRPNPNPLAQAIGQRIKRLRAEQGITSEKLAYESDVGSKGFMSDIENGLALPSLITLERIAERLELRLFDLLVLPERSERDCLTELTRHLPPDEMRRLLAQLRQTVRPPLRAPAPLHPITAFPTLEIGAGWATKKKSQQDPNRQSVQLPGRFSASTDFAARASGDSMHGFRSSIRDGDWLVFKRQRVGPAAVAGKVVLLSRKDRFGDESLHLKRVQRVGRKLQFSSDDPRIKPASIDEEDVILATLRTVVPPESLAPEYQARFARTQFATVFGLDGPPSSPACRVGGHLFVVLPTGHKPPRGLLPKLDLVLHPAETAFVLGTEGTDYVYLGVAGIDGAKGRLCLRDATEGEDTRD
jgi:transcriptional regulator with XRE-family HTH domain